MTTTFNPPRIQNDETLYSYLARCHFLWGQTNPRLTSLDWFGRKGVCLNQCLPLEVNNIAMHSNYPAAYLLSKHTFLPLFEAFVGDSSSVRQGMLGNHGKALANASGVPQLSRAELMYSKICPICFAMDVEKIGVGYWHLMHQFPGLKCCHLHGCCLVERKVNPRGYELPELSMSEKARQSPEMQKTFAKYVASISIGAAAGHPIDVPLVSVNRIDALFRRGSHIDMQGLLFLIKSIEVGLGLPSLLNESCVRNILKGDKHNAHPLKKLLLRFVIDFIPESNFALDKLETNGREQVKREARCLHLLQEYHFSMREISRRVNISVGAIKSLAKRHHIRLDERRQFITADMEKQVVQEAIDGQHRSDIAIKHEISVGAVEQIIESVTGLSLWRQYLRMYDKRNEMRSELTDTLKRLPNASRKTIRNHANRSYIWLFKFDKKWLNKALPHKQPYQYHGYKLWVKRDDEFLPKLTSFLKNQIKNTSAVPTLKAVDKFFGSHGWFTRSIEKLPRCKTAYEVFIKNFHKHIYPR
jgi:predicted DNA-binding protein YlxM (UPF0122 family)